MNQFQLYRLYRVNVIYCCCWWCILFVVLLLNHCLSWFDTLCASIRHTVHHVQQQPCGPSVRFNRTRARHHEICIARISVLNNTNCIFLWCGEKNPHTHFEQTVVNNEFLMFPFSLQLCFAIVLQSSSFFFAISHV